MSLERILSGIHRLGEVRFLSRSRINRKKNLTNAASFGIILIESERVTILNGAGLVRERKPLSLILF